MREESVLIPPEHYTGIFDFILRVEKTNTNYIFKRIEADGTGIYAVYTVQDEENKMEFYI